MKTVLLITKELQNGFTDPLFFSNQISVGISDFKESGSEIIEVEEVISKDGDIILELKENVINNVLRQIFTLKPAAIFIVFNNSGSNAVHEKNMKNILCTAGYKTVFISSDRERFISNLSVMFAKSKDDLLKRI